MNLPIGVAAAVAGWRLLESGDGIGLRAGADAAGAILVTGGLMLAVYTIVQTTRYGWGSAHMLGTAAVALVLLAAFVVRQGRARTPLLPLRVFRSRNVSGANVVQALTVAAVFGFQVLIPQYMQRVLGYGPARAGLAMLPAPRREACRDRLAREPGPAARAGHRREVTDPVRRAPCRGSRARSRACPPRP